MNDMPRPESRPQVQEFFTVAELVEMARRFGYKGFPHSDRGARKRAESQGWNEKPPSRLQQREGKVGGGFEYHISLESRHERLLAAERMMQADKAASRAVACLIDGATTFAAGLMAASALMLTGGFLTRR